MKYSDTFDQVKKWCLGIKTLDEAEAGIRRDGLLKQGLHTWSKRLAAVSITLGVFCLLGAAGVLLLPTAIVAGAWGLTKLGSYLLDRDISNKLAAAHEMAAQETAPEQAPSTASKHPQPQATAKAKGAFKVATQPPANDAAKAPAAKPASLLKRFGLGG
jgi:hypothetical protein